MKSELNIKCEYCGYPLETGEHHPNCFTHFEGKPDNLSEYLSVDTENTQSLKTLPPDEFPREDIDVKDVDAFKRFEFGKDSAGNVWLYRKIEKRWITQRLSEKRELVSRIGKELEIPLVEYKTMEVDGQQVMATRFIPNAIDGRIRYAPNHINEQQAKDLSGLWVFNYLTGNRGDLQVLSTATGRALLADYNILAKIPDSADEEREIMDEYRDFIGGVEERVNAGAMEEVITKIEGLSDETLGSLVSLISDEKLRAELLESLKWRRDNIRDVFIQYAPK